MALDLTQLDRALDATLEAAFDPSLWPGILTDISAATNSYGAVIIPVTARSPQLTLQTESVARALEAYFDEGWHQKEWRLRAVPLLARRGIAREQEYTSRDEFEREDYYRSQSKHRLGRSCIVSFSGPDDTLCLTLHRKIDQDFYDEAEAEILGTIRDRLTASATIMQHLAKSRVQGMSEAFETSGVAAIFFNRRFKVTHVNTNAEALLGDDLNIASGELRSARHQETIRIRERMAAVISERWLLPGTDNGPITVERYGRRPLLLRIQRLGGNLPDFFTHSIGVCLLDDPEAKHQKSIRSLRELFGLTLAEAVVLSHLSEGLSLREIAGQSCQSYETVRTHLKSIFNKTDTRRQSELVALVVGLKNVIPPASQEPSLL